MKFIEEGRVSDLDTISSALRDRENHKSRLSQELETLTVAKDETRLLITLHLVRTNLEKTLSKLTDRGEHYNEHLKGLLVWAHDRKKRKNEISVEGTFDLASALAGSTQCRIALPTVQYANPCTETIRSPIRIFVPVINQKLK